MQEVESLTEWEEVKKIRDIIAGHPNLSGIEFTVLRSGKTISLALSK